MPDLYRNTIAIDKRLIAEIKAKIEAACPNAILEDWQDYGLKLTGCRRGPDGTLFDRRIICQPKRPATDDWDGQPEIIADVDAIIKLWSA